MATKQTATQSKSRVDYKIGTRVKVTRRNGIVAKGFVAPLYDKPGVCVRFTQTGPFIAVNIGTTKEPDVREFRPVSVKGY